MTGSTEAGGGAARITASAHPAAANQGANEKRRGRRNAMQSAETSEFLDLSARYRSGETTPKAAVEACFARIHAAEDKLGAFELLLEERAMAAAEAATRAIASGHRIGPFHGIPFALKDLIDVAGLVTTGGSNAMADRVARGTATIAKRLIAGGGVLVGKTKTVEVAYGPWGTNSRRGAPWNPWDEAVRRAPGGSSSGSGVAVAAGLVPCAIGTDTGGSVRIPAAFCGIVGLKVTEGRLPLDNILPLSHTLDTPGPLCRTPTDAAIVYETLLGREPRLIDADLEQGRGLYGEMARGVQGLRIGALSPDDLGPLDGEILALYDAVLERLRGLGAAVETFPMPVGIEEMRLGMATIMGAEGYHHHGHHYENPANAMDDDVRARIMAGKDVTAAAYIAAQRQRLADRETFLTKMAGLAAIVTPTLPIPAPPVAEIDQTSAPSQFTRMVNHLGFCALSLPMGLAAGLPAGLQIVGRGGEEAMTLRIGQAFDGAFEGIGRPPAFAG